MDYQLIRSKRKTLSLSVEEDLTVVVRAPNRMAKAVIDDFVAQHGDWIQKHLQLQERRNAQGQALTPELEQALRKKAKQIIPERVAHYGTIMDLHPTAVRINGAKTRFGSCGPKNSLNFSFRLMTYPPEAVDYVVVHELAHIRHKNHGAAFYRLIEQYLPDYRARWALLKDPQYRLR